jgi:hypothetical protein
MLAGLPCSCLPRATRWPYPSLRLNLYHTYPSEELGCTTHGTLHPPSSTCKPATVERYARRTPHESGREHLPTPVYLHACQFRPAWPHAHVQAACAPPTSARSIPHSRGKHAAAEASRGSRTSGHGSHSSFSSQNLLLSLAPHVRSLQPGALPYPPVQRWLPSHSAPHGFRNDRQPIMLA